MTISDFIYQHGSPRPKLLIFDEVDVGGNVTIPSPIQWDIK